MFDNHKFHRNKLIVLIILVLGFRTVLCQWSQVGDSFYGGNVTTLITIGEKVFAGTTGGVFTSEDNTHWKATEGLIVGTPRSMIAAGATIYISLQNGKNYKSTDQGKTWLPILETDEVRKFGVIGNTVFALTITGKLYSIDNTNSNTAILTTGLTNVSAMAINDSKIYLGTVSTGLYSSSNLGVNWEQVNTGYTGNIAQIESTGSIIAMKFFNSNNPFVISTDNGVTWNSSIINVGIFSVGQVGNKILVGHSSSVFESTDGGISWNTSNSLPNGIGGLTSNSTALFYGTSSGIYRSMDGGVSWSESNQGITAKWPGRISSIGSTLIVGQGQLYKYEIGISSSWVNISAPSTQNPSVFFVAGNNLLFGTFSNGVFVSSNKGGTWTKANGIFGALCFARYGDNIYAGYIDGIYVSHDTGMTWELFSSTPSVNYLAANNEYLFASNTPGNVFRFTANGQSEIIKNGLPSDQFNDFAFAGKTLICRSSNHGFYSSADNGNTWISDDRFKGLNISSLVQKDQYLFVTKNYEGVLYSFNGGDSWLPFNDGFPGDVIGRSVSSLCLLENKLYASTNSSSIWATSDDQVNLVTGLLSVMREHSLSIYPNPAKNFARVALPNDASASRGKFQIVDAFGKIISTDNCTCDSDFEIDTSTLANGLYILRIFQGGQSFQAKLIVE